MKIIIVQWIVCSRELYKQFGYKNEMRVIHSTHPRFVTGTRFDYGFNGIAVEDGYTILQLPVETSEES